MINYNLNIKKEDIENNIRQEDIFEYYLGVNINTEDSYTSPFRQDKEPGCRFWYNSIGKLRLHDFSRNIHYDYIDVVRKLFSLTYHEALQQIAKDFNLTGDKILQPDKVTTNQRIKKSRPIFQIKKRDWEKRDFDYWNQYKINKWYDTEKYLTYYNIYPCKKIWINGDRFDVNNELCYAYYFGKDKGINLFKFYFPNRKEDRFYQNNYTLLQGYNKLPEYGDDLVITKSYKDVICLRLFNIYAVAPMSESIVISEDQFTDLYNRFDNIYSLMDNDRAGKHLAWLLRDKYEIEALLFPNDMKKDFSDNLKEYEIMEIEDIIQSLK